ESLRFRQAAAEPLERDLHREHAVHHRRVRRRLGHLSRARDQRDRASRQGVTAPDRSLHASVVVDRTVFEERARRLGSRFAPAAGHGSTASAQLRYQRVQPWYQGGPSGLTAPTLLVAGIGPPKKSSPRGAIGVPANEASPPVGAAPPAAGRTPRLASVIRVEPVGSGPANRSASCASLMFQAAAFALSRSPNRPEAGASKLLPFPARMMFRKNSESTSISAPRSASRMLKPTPGQRATMPFTKVPPEPRRITTPLPSFVAYTSGPGPMSVKFANTGVEYGALA